MAQLVVSDFMPRPDRTSGSRRLLAFMKLLAADAPLYFAYAEHHEAAETRAQFDACGMTEVKLISTSPSIYPRNTFAKTIYEVAIFEAWRMAERFLADARRLQPWCSIVVDTVDVHYVREEAAVKLGLMDANKVELKKQRELAMYHAADALIVVTEDDQTILRAAGITQPIFIIPNIVPLIARQKLVRQRELSFIGGFSHPPNLDGLLWFIQECWPAVRAQIPDARLTIVGSDPPEEIMVLANEPGIIYAGCVPDTAPYLQAAAVSIAPLRYGGGMKGKVCEAMAASLPVVTTTVGIQGIPATDRIDVRIADQPEDFSKAVIELLRDETAAEQIGERGQLTISKLCGPNAARQCVEQLLSWTCSRPQPSRFRRLWWSFYSQLWVWILTCRKMLRRIIDSFAQTSK